MGVRTAKAVIDMIRYRKNRDRFSCRFREWVSSKSISESSLSFSSSQRVVSEESSRGGSVGIFMAEEMWKAVLIARGLTRVRDVAQVQMDGPTVRGNRVCNI